jgi:hypothetical protein
MGMTADNPAGISTSSEVFSRGSNPAGRSNTAVSDVSPWVSIVAFPASLLWHGIVAGKNGLAAMACWATDLLSEIP